MDRNRDSRRGVVSMAAPNGLSRRRHRASSLRDSPEEDGGGIELQESGGGGGGRLRERGGGGSKKDRDRLSRSSKRRRGGGGGERLIHGNSNREEGGGGGGGEESTEESLDDDEEDEETTTTTTSDFIRMHPPSSSSLTNTAASSSSMSNHHHHNNNNNHNQIHHQRKSFPPTRTVPWKVSDEMGFSVPKKARTASAKRSPHEYWVSGGGGGGGGGGLGGGGGGGELIHRQASTSPARPATTPSPLSPSSSNASVRKKMKPIGPKHKPRKISSKPSSSPAQEEIEIEIAEVLYGLMRQPQCPSRQEVLGNSSQKFDSRDTTNGSVNDMKSSRVSSPPSMAATQNSSSTSTPSRFLQLNN